MTETTELPNDLRYVSLQRLRAAIREREVSPVEIADATLTLIDKLDGRLNCFAHLDPDDVRRQAKDVEKRLMRGQELGPLAGVPVAIKDLIAVRDQPMQFGSRVMEGNNADQDAPAVERIRNAGGIILGKSTTSEFGCKAVGDSPLTGITRNPWNLDKTPGGSSCGSAALVSSGISPVALGTDGGGSVRIPAALSGLFGIKAHFGRVPVFPVSATPTLAHVGPLSRTVRDSATMLSVIAGEDDRDPFCVRGPVPEFEKACDSVASPLRIAWSPTLGYGEPLPEIVDVCERAARVFEDLGHRVELVDTVLPQDPIDTWVAEFYAGVGTKLANALATRREDIDPEVVDVLDKAVNQQMQDYYQSVFQRYAFRETIRQFFLSYDLLLTPTVPAPAFDVGRSTPPTHDHRSIVSWVYYTYPFNLNGYPAGSVPAGFTDAGLPVGLQLVAGANQENLILSLAASFEQAQPWADKQPQAAG